MIFLIFPLQETSLFPLHLLHRCIFAKNLDFRLQFDALLPVDDALDVRHQGKEIFGSAAAVDKETGVLFAHLCAADARSLQAALINQLRGKCAFRALERTARAEKGQRLLFGAARLKSTISASRFSR